MAFFVTGAGRSGTKWLAEFLNNARDVRVCHEPLMFNAEKVMMEDRLVSDAEAVVFLHERKQKLVAQYGQRQGEVNHYLCYWVEPLRTVFPGVPILGLVRDGRKTVGSFVGRGMYACWDRRKLPTPPDEAVGQFAKCCWFWADVYERLLEQGVDIFTLESLNESYSACKLLCDELGIERVEERIWKQFAQHLIHRGREPLDPRDWIVEQEIAFCKWALAIHQELGYE